MNASHTATIASPIATGPRLVDNSLDIAAVSAHVAAIRRRFEAGQYIYRAGQPFRAVFYVQAGFLRRSVATADGREQVTGFPMPGDLVGVESIGSGQYTVDVVALDHCEVIELPYPAVLNACAAMPSLNGALTHALAQELRRDQYWMLSLGTLSAEQRVAAFLVDMAARHRALGFSASHFVLRMSRIDIASFLALKHETVTRALSQLAASGVIVVDRREIRIACAARLADCASGGAPVQSPRGASLRSVAPVKRSA